MGCTYRADIADPVFLQAFFPIELYSTNFARLISLLEGSRMGRVPRQSREDGCVKDERCAIGYEANHEEGHGEGPTRGG